MLEPLKTSSDKSVREKRLSCKLIDTCPSNGMDMKLKGKPKGCIGPDVVIQSDNSPSLQQNRRVDNRSSQVQGLSQIMRGRNHWNKQRLKPKAGVKIAVSKKQHSSVEIVCLGWQIPSTNRELKQ